MFIEDLLHNRLHGFVLLLVLCVFLSAVLFVAGCSSQGGSTPPVTATIAPAGPVEKIEVFHFHTSGRCSSCTAVGEYAEETVNVCFPNEVKSGKIVFAHINADLAENQELVEKYGVTAPSLWIGVYDAAGFHKEVNTEVWYKINNYKEYRDYLKDILEKRLAGDFS